MTTTQASFTYLAPADMTEDNMEISSDFGGAGDEDIDIDLDIPTEHPDEDHVLDDVKTDTDFDGGFEVQYQGSQVGGKDDLMVDGENPSFRMVDFDAVPEDGLNDAHPFDPNDSEMVPLNQDDTILNEFQSLDSPSQFFDQDDSAEVNWDQDHADNPSIEPNRDVEGELSETLVPNSSSQAKDQEEVSQPLPNSSSNPKSPAAGESDPADVPATVEPATSNSVKTNEGSVPVIDTPVRDLEAENHDGEEVMSSESKDHILDSQEVVVIYQDNEYALIAKSEDDGPDSYFLKDSSATYSPLATLFTTLREVLGDDVSPDDELCLSIDDLGLELTETSLAVDTITFSQLIDLRSALLLNDGVSAPAPAFITLAVKPEFSKKFSALAAGAANGKGLTELVSWDETSHELEDDDEARKEEVGEVVASREEDDAASKPAVVHTPDSLDEHDETFFRDEMTARDSVHNTELEYDHDDVGNFEDGSLDGRALETDDFAKNTYGTSLQSSEISRQTDSMISQVHEDLDEDGDLIDYEDEEFEQEQKQTGASSPNNGTSTDFISICVRSYEACFCQKCNEHLLREYEAINEDLRRRSISDGGNDSTHLAQNYQSSLSIANLTHLVTPPTGNGNDDATPGNGDGADEYSQFVNESIESRQESDSDNSLDEVEGGNEITVLLDENVEQHKAVDDGNFDEIDYEAKINSGELPAHEIGYDDIAQGEDLNASENTLVAEESIGTLADDGTEHVRDEIDYEDDDQEEFAELPEKVVQESSPHPGKRSREEIEDVLDGAGKESKRARS